MQNGYNFYNLEASFKNFLVAGNKTPTTIKNYLSDLRHFLGWNILNFKAQGSKLKVEIEPKNVVESITGKTITEYQAYLASNKIPEKTIKRRLSTLTKFCSFCISQGWMKTNPIKELHITNCELKANPFKTLIDEYKTKVSLDDYNNVNDFISFINSKKL